MKICDTDLFREIAVDSIGREFNRLPSDEFLAVLDPNGTHVLSFSMMHEHKAGVAVEPHMRTIWLAKVDGIAAPVEVGLDMTMENFDRLPEHEPKGRHD